MSAVAASWGPDWQQTDKETEYADLMARNLMLELVGEAGEGFAISSHREQS
jgi:hypothetical protein